MARNRLQYLTENDWVMIQARATRRTFKLGDEIIQQGSWGDKIYVIRRGQASVEIAGTSSRAIVASLGVDDVCGEIAFLERDKATAAVIAKDEEVEVDEISAHELRNTLEAFPRLASRFYQSLALVLAQRLKFTSRELAREMSLRDRCEKQGSIHSSAMPGVSDSE
jgi:extracellular factor (EF) 3-hydroxypalmitic acid methyl ester biosynthesis protein